RMTPRLRPFNGGSTRSIHPPATRARRLIKEKGRRRAALLCVDFRFRLRRDRVLDRAAYLLRAFGRGLGRLLRTRRGLLPCLVSRVRRRASGGLRALNGGVLHVSSLVTDGVRRVARLVRDRAANVLRHVNDLAARRGERVARRVERAPDIALWQLAHGLVA